MKCGQAGIMYVCGYLVYSQSACDTRTFKGPVCCLDHSLSAPLPPPAHTPRLVSHSASSHIDSFLYAAST